MTESESVESTEITHANAWAIALMPVIGPVIGLIHPSVGILSLVILIILVIQDRKSLKAYGIEDPPSFWWWLIGIVYLWKRANLLDGNKILAWVWVGSMIVGTAINTIVGTD
jgi:hypothetical protein